MHKKIDEVLTILRAMHAATLRIPLEVEVISSDLELLGDALGSHPDDVEPPFAWLNERVVVSWDHKLDRYGVAWCEQNTEHIVQYLVDQSEHLIPAFRVVPASGRQAIAERLVRKAIKSAKA